MGLTLRLLVLGHLSVGQSAFTGSPRSAPVQQGQARSAQVLAVLSVPPPGSSAGDFELPPRRRRLDNKQLPPEMVAVQAKAAQDAGFVFGRASVESTLTALREGSMVMLTEDGEDSTHASLIISPSHVTESQLQFFLEHSVRMQVALEPERYRAVYRSLRRIVLDNNNLEYPAISVSATRGGQNPRNVTHIALAVRALMAEAESSAAKEPEAPTLAADAEPADGTSDVSDAPGVARPRRRVGRDAAREVATSYSSLVCPGAVSLGCVREGGVLRRAGATEAAVELAKLAGLPAMGLHATLRLRSLDELRRFADNLGIAYSSTADVVAYARAQQQLVERCSQPVKMPTKFGRFVAHTYRSRVDGTEHIALVKADGIKGGGDGGSGGGADGHEYPLRPFAESARPALVRVHSECCTGDIFGSLRCDCGVQLESALQEIEADGWGVLLYLRGQEGRGIGLGAKMHAYALQERGVDTLDANLQLGLPIDSREYGTGAQILVDLGIEDMRLMSNNPKKFTGLTGYGLRIVERVPTLTAPNPENLKYLITKRERMGHMLGSSGEGSADDSWVTDANGSAAAGHAAELGEEAETSREDHERPTSGDDSA